MTKENGTPIQFTRRRLIEWSECDPAGIVYYPRYAEIFDANTNALFHHVTGMTKRQIQAEHQIVGWPMVDSQVSFYAPATYGDEVEVTSHVAGFGSSSIELQHRIAHLNGTVIAAGKDKRIWVGKHPDKPDAIKAKPLPEAFTAGFFTAD